MARLYLPMSLRECSLIQLPMKTTLNLHLTYTYPKPGAPWGVDGSCSASHTSREVDRTWEICTPSPWQYWVIMGGWM
eukprot:5157652-Pyramimonas_sp.AAC.1